jgi:hypothetical protein
MFVLPGRVKVKKYAIAADVAQAFGRDVVLAVEQAERNEREERGVKSDLDWNTMVGVAQLIIACVQTAMMLKQMKGTVDAAALERSIVERGGGRAVAKKKARRIAKEVKAIVDGRKDLKQ